MRLLASRTEAQQLKIAEGLGVEGSGRAASEVIADAADTLERFIASLGVPTRLRDTAARRDEIPAVAKAVAFELAHMGRLEDLENGEASVVELLDSLW
jgi:alcohol dehydrogenase class IV